MLRAAVCILILALAGCTSGKPDVDRAVVGVYWADVEGCDWRYPDGSLVPCESKTKGLGNPAPIPFGWTCTQMLGTETAFASIYRNPTIDQYGLRVKVPIRQNQSGIFVIRDGPSLQYNFSTRLQDVFFRIPDALPPRFRPTIYVFEAEYSGQIRNETFVPQQLWTIYKEQPWLIHEFVVSGEKYHLQNVTRNPFTGMLQSTADFRIAGVDFNVTFNGKNVLGVDGVEVITALADPRC